jgi:hypothetical protein
MPKLHQAASLLGRKSAQTRRQKWGEKQIRSSDAGVGQPWRQAKGKLEEESEVKIDGYL